MKYIIDASVALRWFLADEKHPHADIVLERLVARPEYFAVPELFCFEVFAALNRLHEDPTVFREGVLPLIENGLLRYPMTEELESYSRAYCAQGLTGYDATYVGLAELLDAIWITFDTRAHRLIETTGRSFLLTEELPDFT